MNNIFYIEEKLKQMYNVNNVRTGYDYWFYKLLNIMQGMFEWDNLPDNVYSREIELNLLITGHCLFVDTEKGLFTPLSSISGVDEYYQPTFAMYANPVIKEKKQLIIGENCEVVYNNSLKDSIWYRPADSGLFTFICRYARQLADIEATINIYLVNSRLTSYPVTDDQSVTQSIKAFFKKLTMGERAIISDNSIIEKFRNIDVSKTNIKDGINDLLVARDKILEMFYRDLGVQMYNPKRAQVSEMELESNDQLLLISTDDMLKERKEGIEKVNNMFGTSIDVKLNDKFNVEKQKEKMENEKQNNTTLYGIEQRQPKTNGQPVDVNQG